MSKMHHKPHIRKDKKFDIGFSEEWKFKNLESLGVSFHTIVGGREKIMPTKTDRVIIVHSGMATNLNTKEIVREGDIVELPAGTIFHFRGQLKYYMIEIHS